MMEGCKYLNKNIKALIDLNLSLYYGIDKAVINKLNC